MSVVVPQSPVIDAVLTVLETTAWGVGDAQAPDGEVPPYFVVYSLEDESYSGPINNTQTDVFHNFQITNVGETAEQARKLGDKAREVLTVAALDAALAGRSVQQIELRSGSQVERDPDDSPPVFYSVDVWRVITTPA